jgi:hypothetical protein
LSGTERCAVLPKYTDASENCCLSIQDIIFTCDVRYRGNERNRTITAITTCVRFNQKTLGFLVKAETCCITYINSMQPVAAVTCTLFSLQDIILFSQSRNYFWLRHTCARFVSTVLVFAQIAHLISLKLILTRRCLTITDISRNKPWTIKYEIIYSHDMWLKSRSDVHTHMYSERTRKLWHDVGVRGKIIWSPEVRVMF